MSDDQLDALICAVNNVSESFREVCEDLAKKMSVNLSDIAPMLVCSVSEKELDEFQNQIFQYTGSKSSVQDETIDLTEVDKRLEEEEVKSKIENTPQIFVTQVAYYDKWQIRDGEIVVGELDVREYLYLSVQGNEELGYICSIDNYNCLSNQGIPDFQCCISYTDVHRTVETALIDGSMLLRIYLSSEDGKRYIKQVNTFMLQSVFSS